MKYIIGLLLIIISCGATFYITKEKVHDKAYSAGREAGYSDGITAGFNNGISFASNQPNTELEQLRSQYNDLVARYNSISRTPVSCSSTTYGMNYQFTNTTCR